MRIFVFLIVALSAFSASAMTASKNIELIEISPASLFNDSEKAEEYARVRVRSSYRSRSRTNSRSHDTAKKNNSNTSSDVSESVVSPSNNLSNPFFLNNRINPNDEDDHEDCKNTRYYERYGKCKPEDNKRRK